MKVNGTITLAILMTLATCQPALAEPLARSGTIRFHTGWKAAGEPVSVADKHFQGHGSVVGVTFNDLGGGPLHRGPAVCVFTYYATPDAASNKGYCTFGDADGDRIFSDFAGESSGNSHQGKLEILGGTGKYAGIKGGGEWRCTDLAAAGQQGCNQRLDYRLP